MYADFFFWFFILCWISLNEARFRYGRLCKTSIRLNSLYTRRFYRFYSLGLLQNVFQYDFLIVYRFIQFFFLIAIGVYTITERYSLILNHYYDGPVESWLHEMGGDYCTYIWYACWLLTRQIKNIYTTTNNILKRKLAVIN